MHTFQMHVNTALLTGVVFAAFSNPHAPILQRLTMLFLLFVLISNKYVHYDEVTIMGLRLPSYVFVIWKYTCGAYKLRMIVSNSGNRCLLIHALHPFLCILNFLFLSIAYERERNAGDVYMLLLRHSSISPMSSGFHSSPVSSYIETLSMDKKIRDE